MSLVSFVRKGGPIIVAAYLVAAVSQSWAAGSGPFMEMNTDRPGADYRVMTMSQPVPQSCARACDQDGQCKAWTFVRPGAEGDLATCHLKLDVPFGEATPCCISGVSVGSGALLRRTGI